MSTSPRDRCASNDSIVGIKDIQLETAPSGPEGSKTEALFPGERKFPNCSPLRFPNQIKKLRDNAENLRHNAGVPNTGKATSSTSSPRVSRPPSSIQRGAGGLSTMQSEVTSLHELIAQVQRRTSVDSSIRSPLRALQDQRRHSAPSYIPPKPHLATRWAFWSRRLLRKHSAQIRETTSWAAFREKASQMSTEQISRSLCAEMNVSTGLLRRLQVPFFSSTDILWFRKVNYFGRTSCSHVISVSDENTFLTAHQAPRYGGQEVHGRARVPRCQHVPVSPRRPHISSAPRPNRRRGRPPPCWHLVPTSRCFPRWRAAGALRGTAGRRGRAAACCLPGGGSLHGSPRRRRLAAPQRGGAGLTAAPAWPRGLEVPVSRSSSAGKRWPAELECGGCVIMDS